MKSSIVLFLLFSLLTLFSCTQFTDTQSEEPIARVNDEYLYLSDIRDLVATGLSEKDSLEIVRSLIEEWINNQLLLNQAEKYLPESSKDIEKQVEKYRSSLLIYKYKQNLISENIDTLVSYAEIESYYEENSSNYILNSDVLKITFIKVPVSAPQINDVRNWYRSSRESSLLKLEEYCTEYAENYIINGENWIRIGDLFSQLPLNLENPSRYLNYNTNIEASDSSYHYFVHVNERLKEGEIAPLEMVVNNIRNVIMNKRKVEYIQDLENTVYQDGVNRNQVEIY